MRIAEQQRALRTATQAARSAGEMMRQNLRAAKLIKAASQHDIKLDLDERCQRRIESILQRAFPEVAILGEEGVQGEAQSEYRWVVDPIDGTVNFTYGIPHACVSIALQRRNSASRKARPSAREKSAKQEGAETLEAPDAAYDTLLGVVYDPFCDELFSGRRGRRAELNGRPICVSRRRLLEECVVSVGFAKTAACLEQMLPVFGRLVHRVRKIRIMGSAALSLAYVAAGRMDAYLEPGVRLWDIAAGGLILTCAGGDFWHRPVPGPAHSFRLLASNGLLRGRLARLAARPTPRSCKP